MLPNVPYFPSYCASMRPRHFAGESYGSEARIAGLFTGFNEAPAFRRGKYSRPGADGGPVRGLQ